MPLTKQEITKAIESALIDAVPLRPNIVEPVPIDGIRAIYTPAFYSPETNIVGQAQLDENTVDSTIEKVIAFYKSKNHSCSWITSDSSQPHNLPERLEHHGFQKIFDLAGLYLADFDKAIHPNPDVTVRMATPDDNEQLIRLYTEAYPMPEESAQLLLENLTFLSGRNYLAYVEESENPVSVANMFYLPDKPIVALQGTATLPDFRGRGIYTSLMAKRLQDARVDGIEVAIMQGDVDTSAPICLKLGFQKVSDMTIYAWINNEEES